MILLVSHDGDDHLVPVRDELDRLGSRSVIVDTSRIPAVSAMSARYSAHGDRWRLRQPDGSWLDLTGCRSGWWRRALPPEHDARIVDPAQASWALNETYEAMSGLWDALPITWVSPPRAIEMSMMKTWQLSAARAAGLEVPETLVTTDPAEARAFIDRLGLGKVVCKAFSATIDNWRETRMIGPAEYALLNQVAVAPVIFQEFVPAEVDLRITIVGEKFFAAAIHSQELPYALDFRLFLDTDTRVRMEPARLPDEVEQGLLRLLERADLRYGAVDMRLTPEGRYMFLEVNPVGQWRFVEDITGQPITGAMARLLTDLDQA